ncbi:MFS transporter, partial [Candidatus Bathyarchaeota archaeon]|nr:MFS transporter [Candidatus Bathyarchaeota archaeon]
MALQESIAREKSERTILSIVTLSHVSQHFYVGISVLYPEMMKELAMNYTQLGVITGTSSMISGFLQMVWSIMARYLPRRILLGLGNVLVSTGCFLTGGSNRFVELMGGNIASASGAAAQHPIGTSILAQKFSKEKITGALSLHYGLGYIGNIISPILLSLIAVSLGWRQAIYILAVVPLLTGLTVFYYLRGDSSTSRATSKKAGTNLWKDLRSAIPFKSAFIIIAAEAFAIGGSGMGVITTYTPVFLKNFLGVGSFETSVIYSISVIGGVTGTLLFGRLARKYGNLKIASIITAASSVLILL